MRTIQLLPGLIGLALVLAASCTGGSGPGFGGGGSGNDTVPHNDGTDTGDTGMTDSGMTDSGTADGGGTTDGGTTDGGAGDSGDTGIQIVGTGYAAGDTAYDLSTTNQTGATWSLHAQYGTPVLLIVGDMDDVGFQSMMGWLGSVSGVTTVALVGRDENGATADTADAAGWASSYGVDAVLTDATATLVNTWAERNPPKTYVIQSDMVIYWTWFGTADQVQVQDKIRAMPG